MRWLKITKHRWCLQRKSFWVNCSACTFWPILSSDILCLECKWEKHQEESLESFQSHLWWPGIVILSIYWFWWSSCRISIASPAPFSVSFSECQRCTEIWVPSLMWYSSMKNYHLCVKKLLTLWLLMFDLGLGLFCYTTYDWWGFSKHSILVCLYTCPFLNLRFLVLLWCLPPVQLMQLIPPWLDWFTFQRRSMSPDNSNICDASWNCWNLYLIVETALTLCLEVILRWIWVSPGNMRWLFVPAVKWAAFK